MSVRGNVCLLIRAKALDFENIESTIKVKPTNKIVGGEIISEAVGEMQYDVFSYAINFYDEHSIDEKFDILFGLIYPHKEYLRCLSTDAEVQIRFYVQSDLAQVYFELSPKICRKLSEIGIKLSISVFSWGGAET